MGALCGYGESAAMAVSRGTVLPEYISIDGEVYALVRIPGMPPDYEALDGIASIIPFSPPAYTDPLIKGNGYNSMLIPQ